MRKIIAVIAAAITLASGALVVNSVAANADVECSPGQHGNPHGGFKPGPC